MLVFFTQGCVTAAMLAGTVFCVDCLRELLAHLVNKRKRIFRHLCEFLGPWQPLICAMGSQLSQDERSIAFSNRVRQVQNQARLQSLRSFLRKYPSYLSPFVIPMFLPEFRRCMFEPFDDADAIELLGSGQIIGVSTGILVILAARWRPTLITKTLCRCYFGFWMVRFMLAHVLATEIRETAIAMRLLMALLLGEVELVLAFNGAVGIARIVSALLDEKCEASPISAFMIEFIITGCIAGAVFLVENAGSNAIASELKAKDSQRFEAAADQLLSGMCDAVLHLSEVVRPAPKLAALLLRQATLEGGLHHLRVHKGVD